MAAGPAGAGGGAAEEERQHPGTVVAQRDLRPDEGALRQGEGARRAGADAVRPALERAEAHDALLLPAAGLGGVEEAGGAGVGVGEDDRVLLRPVGIVGHPVGRAPGGRARREHGKMDEDVGAPLERAAEPGAGERAIR